MEKPRASYCGMHAACCILDDMRQPPSGRRLVVLRLAERSKYLESEVVRMEQTIIVLFLMLCIIVVLRKQ